MKKLKTFNQFLLNESSSAGNRGETFSIPFSYSSHDPKSGYNSKTFVADLESIFIEKPRLKKEILKFLSNELNIYRIQELQEKPFYYIKNIIPEIERIISAEEYEPEMTMPGGALLFIRNKKIADGRQADFYMNRKGTKIEVIFDSERGVEKCEIYDSSRFPFDRFDFTKEEKEETLNMIKGKGN